MRFALMIEPQQAYRPGPSTSLLAQRAEQSRLRDALPLGPLRLVPWPPGPDHEDAFATIAGLVRETARSATARWSRP